MGKPYREELDQFPQTLRWAAEQPVELLTRAVRLLGDRGLLAVGSGGSYTAAAYAAELHLRSFAHVSRPMTPQETFSLEPRVEHCAGALLLSAEGKNHDILAAARRFALRGVHSVGLTLRSESPFVYLCHDSGAATVACCDMPCL